MGRRYTAIFAGVAVTAQQDFFEILAPTTGIVIVHAWELSQSTEIGDAMEEGLSVKVVRGVGSVTSGTGGTTPTAQGIENLDAAFAGVVDVNNTTKMVVGTGTLEQLESYNWNVRVPFQKIYTPETRPVIGPGNRLTVELATTPADTITMSGSIWFEEVG